MGFSRGRTNVFCILTVMPYDSVKELPGNVKAKLKGKKRRQWMHIFNSEHAKHGDESRAFASAWSVVNKRDNSHRRIFRDAFIYLEPLALKNDDDFAQCSSCVFFHSVEETCAIHGKSIRVKSDASCDFYLNGLPNTVENFIADLDSRYTGLVRRQVRCENCRYSGSEATVCNLFKTLNEKLPELFDCETVIEPKACCNAQEPKDDE